MILFQPPPPTRYDVNFSIFGTSVRVHPLFWLLILAFGITAGSNLISLLIWLVVASVSLLAHELGHALAFRRFGIPSSIILYWGGGLTVPSSPRWGFNYNVSLTPTQNIFVSLAGPLAGFALAGLVLLLSALAGGMVRMNSFGFIPMPEVITPWGGWIAAAVVGTFVWVNFFWGVINLMPVYPLDGGSIARNLWLKLDPYNGVRKSLWLSVITGAVVALFGLFVFRSIFIAFLFGYLAFMSYQSLNPRMF